MIRIFEHPSNESKEWRELILIDDEKEIIKIYCQNNKLGFPFSEHVTSLKEYGYKSADDYKRTMKQRNNGTIEIDVDKQLESERIGLINLKAEQERIKDDPLEYKRRLSALRLGV